MILTVFSRLNTSLKWAQKQAVKAEKWDRALALFASHGIAAVHEMAGPDISSRTDLTELLARDGTGPLVTA